MDEQGMKGSAQVLRGNALDLPLANDTVDLVVTSPPYFGLRSYQDGGEHYDGQIGDEATPAEFVAALVAATAEMARVLKPAGSIWVNLGDKYAGGGGYAPDAPSNVGNNRHGDGKGGARSASNRGAAWGHKPKTLIGIPWRYAIRCIDDLGLILRAEVIWSKPNGLPESVTDRVRRSHEQWFHFTLNPRYYSAVDEIRERYDAPNARRTLGKIPGSVWDIATQPLRVPEELGIAHFAAFPMEWPRRIIQGWSPRGVCVECGEGLRPITTKDGGRPVARAHRHLPGYADPAGEGMRDQTYRIEGYECTCHVTTHTTAPNPATPSVRPGVVLDPFGGTGTTATVAKALGRHGISVDMSADYCRLAEWRTNDPRELDKARHGVGRHKEHQTKPVKPAHVIDLPTEPDLFGEGVA